MWRTSGVVQYNRFSANAVAIAVSADMSSQVNGVRIWYNLFYRNTVAGIQVTGASNVRIYQNTFYSLTGDNIHISGGSSNVDIQGNILWAQGGYDIYVANDSQSGFFSDYNDLYKSGTGKLVYWTQDFTDILDWQDDVGRYDLHSIGATVVNPLWAMPSFVDVDQNNFQVFATVASLRASSPTMGAANVLMDQALPTFEQNANLISNPSFESGTTGWSVNAGGAVATTAQGAVVTGAYDGTQLYAPGSVSQGFAQQTVNLVSAGFSTAQLDSGLLQFAFGGRIIVGNLAPRDTGTVTLSFLDTNGKLISSQVVNASNVDDRWELVGGRVSVPIGARFAVLRFDAFNVSGGVDQVYFDNAFLYAVSNGYAPNQGAYGAGTQQAASTSAPQILLRYPDFYVNWDENTPHTIQWETLNNNSSSEVRIDLYQDTANGPVFLKTIVAATPDTGSYVWIPSNSGIPYNTGGLRLQVSLVNSPSVLDRSQETFTVPPNGQNYYVNDQSTVGDQYTTAVGNNRNTGKTPDSPLPNPVNVLRTYQLGAGSTLYIDTGNYPMIDPIAASGSVDVSLIGGPGLGFSQGFTITGPTNAGDTAALFPAIAGNRIDPLIYLNSANYVTIENLTLENANRGVYVVGNSVGFSASNITTFGNLLDGFNISTNAPFADLNNLVSYNNGGTGITIAGTVGAVTDSVAYGNTGWGFVFNSPVATLIQGDSSYANYGGFYLGSAERRGGGRYQPGRRQGQPGI